jgi:hypothetical protein
MPGALHDERLRLLQEASQREVKAATLTLTPNPNPNPDPNPDPSPDPNPNPNPNPDPDSNPNQVKEAAQAAEALEGRNAASSRSLGGALISGDLAQLGTGVAASLNPLAGVLGSVQPMLGRMLRALRSTKRMLIWTDRALTLWLLLVCHYQTGLEP